MDAEQCLRAGDIPGARAALAAELKRAPQDVRARQFFWQLMAVVGELDKADAQLKALGGVQASAMMMGSVYMQAINAERLRDRTFAGDLAPKSLVGTEPWVAGLLDALAATIRGAPDAAARHDAALAEAPASPGSIDGTPFEWLADADTRFGPMLEVVIGADYGFIPFAAMNRIRAAAVADLRDTVWRPAEIGLKSGQSSMVFIPARYPGTVATGDPALMLGRRTDWTAAGDIEIGLGQRLLATDTDDHGVLEPFDIRLG
ncbi:type VI secretion system accessory protein TagJ [Polymorphobacter fuscus]|uniref:Virulence protein SciE type n=1 Tax=Sandarakinorhabdus fusca TaxID=1439888 RepID=A0A7C9GPM1_9SPHN|nr:type VI secretion system accessory protein TagJ [Polymorphobacter fuscus]KAB7648282.1 virulence protein SciE type [Polymorphobacter fuscus]MQT15791.1 virulence protein SciE type [Polymorphobacter fuscus]NJC07936.1 type VI secretion system protein ImpE [Polymorphobacter fuscus]